MTTKGITYTPDQEIEYLKHMNGTVTSGPNAGSVRLDTDKRVCEMILAFSGTSNGRLAVQGFRQLEKRTGQSIAPPDILGVEDHRVIGQVTGEKTGQTGHEETDQVPAAVGGCGQDRYSGRRRPGAGRREGLTDPA